MKKSVFVVCAITVAAVLLFGSIAVAKTTINFSNIETNPLDTAGQRELEKLFKRII